MESQDRISTAKSLTVGITGASGLVGSALATRLTEGRHRVIPFVRAPQDPNALTAMWDPAKGVLELEKLEGVDAIVHLAGENIARGRWTQQKKERILSSRVEGTTNLIRSLQGLKRLPETFVCASAIGIYGDRGSEILDEASSMGSGFLADVCQRWEAAAGKAADLGMKVAMARTGVVLTPAGGALAKMLPAFRMGAGGKIGSGEQFMSWISIDDVAEALIHILMDRGLEGPVNLVSPNPVSNGEFTRELAAVLRRPAIMPIPALGARALFGQMADEALLASTRVVPGKLDETGYVFRDTELGPTLRRLLDR